MKFLLGLLFLFFTLGAFAQEYPDSGFTNKAEAKNLMVNGLKEGKWVEYYRYYSNGYGMGLKLKKLQFPHTRNYHLLVYKMGKIRGIDRQYSDNKLISITHYLNGLRNGDYIFYNENNGSTLEIIPFTNDTINGVMKEYTLDGRIDLTKSVNMGKVVYDTSYRNQKLDRVGSYNKNGNWVEKEFDTLGKIRSIIIDTVIDTTHYIERTYWGSGELEWESFHTNGEKIVLEKEYYPNGRLEFEATYVYGMQEGPEKDYYENGNLYKEFNVIDNKIDGIYKEYYEDGKISNKNIYKRGKMKQIIYYDDKTGKAFDKNGKEIK